MHESLDIVHTALENLFNQTGISGNWIPSKNFNDGYISIVNRGKMLEVPIEIKREIRTHHIPQIKKLATGHDKFMLVAEHIFPKIKTELRQFGIAYLEANGNIYLDMPEMYLLIDNNKPIETGKKKSNKAFTKSGLKLIFHFLLEENLLRLTYREISERAEVSLGIVSQVVNNLKDLGYVLEIDRGFLKLNNKRELLDKWISGYHDKLKPSLKIGTFRFLKSEDLLNWKNIPLKNMKSWWGGEAAADMLTSYLKPSELTIYTTESRSELTKHYRLVADKHGNVKVYQKFWTIDEVNYDFAPPLLIYADLISEPDNRCRETAQKIFHELLEDKF